MKLHDVCGSTLLLDGDLLYACTSNGIDDHHDKTPKPDAPSLIVLDKNSGRLLAKDDVRIGRRMFHCNCTVSMPAPASGTGCILWGRRPGVLRLSSRTGKCMPERRPTRFGCCRRAKKVRVLSRSRLKSMPITPTAAEGVLYLPLQNRLLALPGKPVG